MNGRYSITCVMADVREFLCETATSGKQRMGTISAQWSKLFIFRNARVIRKQHLIFTQIYSRDSVAIAMYIVHLPSKIKLTLWNWHADRYHIQIWYSLFESIFHFSSVFPFHIAIDWISIAMHDSLRIKINYFCGTRDWPMANRVCIWIVWICSKSRLPNMWLI